MNKEQWTVYIIQAKNDNLYIGITKNLPQRFANHQKGKAGARFSAPDSIEPNYSNRSQPTKRETEIKKMTRKQKNTLIARKGFLITTKE